MRTKPRIGGSAAGFATRWRCLEHHLGRTESQLSVSDLPYAMLENTFPSLGPLK